ncbi:MAG: hypothetical protein AAF481_12465 [Acidobacteriota bacterium]
MSEAKSLPETTLLPHHGDPVAELSALRTGAGHWSPSPDRLSMTGADRQRFLHGLVTCEVKELLPGQGSYGFVSSAKGRILADIVVSCRADDLLLELPAGLGATLREHLEKYIIADRVETASAEELAPWIVAGPVAMAELAERSGGALCETVAPWAGVEATLGESEFWAVRRDHLGAPGWTLWAESSAAAAIEEALAAFSQPVGALALEALRVEHGQPAFGVDFGPDNFPKETGLDDAVSYTKGCYLGQEVIARIHYRGGVNRRLCRVVPQDGANLELGMDLSWDGRAVGTVTSLDRVSEENAAGLAIVHKKAKEIVELPDGGTARLEENRSA